MVLALCFGIEICGSMGFLQELMRLHRGDDWVLRSSVYMVPGD
jgi:hypothetical protein